MNTFLHGTVLLEKLVLAQLVWKLPVLYVARHCRAHKSTTFDPIFEPREFIPRTPFLKINLNVILLPRPGYSVVSLLQVTRQTFPRFSSVSHVLHARPSHTPPWFVVKSVNDETSLLCNFLQPPVVSTLHTIQWKPRVHSPAVGSTVVEYRHEAGLYSGSLSSSTYWCLYSLH